MVDGSPSDARQRPDDAQAHDAFSTNNRYEIRAFLGSGGMGQVYRAWDRTLSREVALKVLRNTDPRAEQRALREARLQSRVEHPAICRILDVGRQDDRPYIAMELIEGPTLSTLAETLDREALLRCLLPVLRGIDAAHRAGLVHRDLKPGNILVRRAEPTPELVVVDFGLARALADDGGRLDDADRLTVTGQVLGTPAYMSPEQIRGEPSLDARADIYSLGCVLFELVAGETPFRDTSEIEVMLSTIQRPVPRLRGLADDVSPALERVIETCLEKDPADRYETAERLADDLVRALDGAPITLDGHGVSARARRWARHHPRALRGGLAFGLGLLVVGALAWTGWQGRLQSELEAQAAQRFGARAERLAASLRLARLAPAHSLATAKAAGRQEMAALEAEARALGSWGLPAARYALGVASLGLGQLEPAQAHLEAALDDDIASRDPAVVEALTDVLIRRFSRHVEHLAYLRRDLRQHRFDRLRDQYLAEIQRLVDDAATHGPTDGTLDALRHLADQAWDEAIAACRRSIDADANHWRCHELIGQIHRIVGVEADLAGDEARAIAQLRLAIESFARATAIARSDERIFAKACLAESMLLDFELRSGQMPSREAPEACQTAIDIDRTMPEPHLARALVLQRTAVAEFRASRSWNEPLRQAEESLRRALVSISAARSADASVIANSLMAVQLLIEHDLGSWHGESDADLLDRAAAAARAALAQDPGHFNAQITLGQILFKQATLAAPKGMAARSFYREGVALLEATTHDAPMLAQAWTQLAIFHDWYSQIVAADGGDPAPLLDRARAAFQRAVELDPNNPTILVNLGITYLFEAGRLFHRGEPTADSVDAGNRVFLAAIELSPDRALLHYNRAELLTTKVRAALEGDGDASLAMDELRQAHALPFAKDPIEYGCSQGKVEWLQARTDRSLGNDPRAALDRGFRSIDAVLEHFPESWRCLRDRGRLGLEAHLGQPTRSLDRAHQDLDAALAIHPRSAELLRLKAQLALASAEAAATPAERQRFASTAREALEAAEALRPGYRHLARDLGRADRLAAS